MPFNTDVAAHQIQERLKYIYQTVRDIEVERNRSEQSLNEVIKAHEKVTPDDKVTPYYQQKLRNLYNTAVQDAQREEDLLRKALVKINEIRAIRNERRIQVLLHSNLYGVDMPFLATLRWFLGNKFISHKFEEIESQLQTLLDNLKI